MGNSRMVTTTGGPGRDGEGPEEIPEPAGHALARHLVQVPGVDEVPHLGSHRHRDDNTRLLADCGREFDEDAVMDRIGPRVCVDHVAEKVGEGVAGHYRPPPAVIILTLSGSGAAHARSQSSLSDRCCVLKSRPLGIPIFQSAIS